MGIMGDNGEAACSRAKCRVVPSEMEGRADSSFILKFYLYICIADATKSDDTR